MSSTETMARSFDPTRIKALREAKGWTVDKLAGEAGCTRQNIVNIEAGQMPKAPLLGRLADAFGVSIEEFYKKT